jgi:hypothetical protein
VCASRAAPHDSRNAWKTGTRPVLADRVVAKLRETERALAFAVTVHQAKLQMDIASAQEVFARRLTV